MAHIPNHIDYIEFPAPDAAAHGASKAFYEQIFGWKYQDWGSDYSDTQGSGLDRGSAVSLARARCRWPSSIPTGWRARWRRSRLQVVRSPSPSSVFPAVDAFISAIRQAMSWRCGRINRQAPVAVVCFVGEGGYSILASLCVWMLSFQWGLPGRALSWPSWVMVSSMFICPPVSQGDR